MTASTSGPLLSNSYKEDSERVRRDFEGSGSGRACVLERTTIVDTLLRALWVQQAALHSTEGCTLVALGGYGRRSLFPHSDIDLLTLCGAESLRARVGNSVREFCQQLWDMGLRVSSTIRTPEDCGRLDQENIELTISLLDCRLLAGDAVLFARLHDKIVPQLVAREADTLVQRLTDITNTRHARFGNTIFHLEPNLKDGPGGLRDFNITRWITLITALAANRSWPESLHLQQNPEEDDTFAAAEFMSSARCYLHYYSNRDDNVIRWEAQDDLACRGIGSADGPISSADWMRLYYRNAKAICRNANQLLDRSSSNRSSLVRSFRRWRSRTSSDEFSIVDRRVYIQQSAGARDPDVVLRLFVFMAHHGVRLALETERRLINARRSLGETMPQDAGLWAQLRELLVQPYAAEALRSMHSLRLLALAVPEYETIDSLVLRDLHHRYTVDEHTFLTIDTLHRLRDNEVDWLKPFAELFSELERPELLFLALLLHDIGKGLDCDDHVQASLQLGLSATTRLGLNGEDAQTVCSLIASHLEMSSTVRRRDIYDPETARAMAVKTETPERLKMLTLLTLADVKSANPDALTPWKAENLWRLYVATDNYFTRHVDGDRFHADGGTAEVERIAALLPASRPQLLRFLEGLPQRYLLSHSPAEVVHHFQMASRLPEESVQLELRRGHDQHELTVVTADRQGLFSTLTGILYGWGMDIIKASAFSNHEDVVVDGFHFKDRFRTLELNPPERERFRRSIIDILDGRASLDRIIEPRLRADTKPPKLKVNTHLHYDNDCSPTSTLLEVVTQNRPGLLHTISATLAAEECSIQIALIDTEGAMAHDVFYLTSGGQKLSRERQRDVEWSLTTELAGSLPSSW